MKTRLKMKKFFHAYITPIMIGLALIAMATAAEAAPKKKAKAAPVAEVQEPVDEAFEAKLVVDPNMAAEKPAMEAQVTLPGENLETAPVLAVVPTPAPTPDVNKAAESEIPVLASAKEAKKAEGGQFARLMATLGILAVALGGASYGLKRWMAKSGATKQNTRIKVLTQHHLGPKKSIAIIQVAGESLLIGVTDQNISMLKTLSLLDDEIPEAVPQSFNRALTDFDEEDGDSNQADADPEENFTINGLAEIRDKVSTRMKNMRRI